MSRFTVHSRYSPEEKFVIDEKKWSDHFSIIRRLIEASPQEGDITLPIERAQVGEIQNFIQAYYGPLSEETPEREVVTTNFILQLPSIENFLSQCYRLGGWMDPFYIDLFHLLDNEVLRVNLHTLPEETQADFFECVEFLSNLKVSPGVLRVLNPEYQQKYQELVRINLQMEEEWDREASKE